MATGSALAHRVHVIDDGDEEPEEPQPEDHDLGGLFARVDLRSGFARVGLADVEPDTHNDSGTTGNRHSGKPSGHAIAGTG